MDLASQELDPREAFILWFDNLPAQLQQDTALFAGAFLGLMPPSPSPETPDRYDQFLEKLREYLDVKPVVEQVGKLLSLKSVIDFALMRERSTPDSWKQTKNQMEDLLAHLQDQDRPEAQEQLREYLNCLPFRSKQWIRHAAAWRELCDTHLSEDNLHNWYVLDLYLRLNRLAQARQVDK